MLLRKRSQGAPDSAATSSRPVPRARRAVSQRAQTSSLEPEEMETEAGSPTPAALESTSARSAQSVEEPSHSSIPHHDSESLPGLLDAGGTTVLYHSAERPEKLVYVPGQNCEILNQLAQVYYSRLPKMAVRYLRKRTARCDHMSMVLLYDDRVIGGLTFRQLTSKVAELVFLSVSTDFGASGYGRWIIANLRELLRIKRVPLLLTYADNTATGFFEKCGFTPCPSRKRWLDLILQVGPDRYEVSDATLMQMHPMEDPAQVQRRTTRSK